MQARGLWGVVDHWKGNIFVCVTCSRDSVVNTDAMHCLDQVLVVAHANTIRALVKTVDEISDEDIRDLRIPNSIPLVCSSDFCASFCSRRSLLFWHGTVCPHRGFS